MTTRRLRLDLSYDGTDFSGWASQPGLRTVQGTLEEWITTVLRLDAPAQVICAGRTDAGVHARGQVCHLDLDPDTVPAPSSGPRHEATELLQRRLTRALPHDITVHDVSWAPAGFDARFAAIWRRYCYRIVDLDSRRDPLLRSTVARVDDHLDIDAMNDAATLMLGLRDFAAFCKKRDGATTIRTLTDCRAERIAHGERAGTVTITVQADAFCHSMVRSLVGALVTVGSRKRDLHWLAGLLERQERSGEITVMPAGGLTLEEVGYPADDELAARAVEARATRELPSRP